MKTSRRGSARPKLSIRAWPTPTFVVAATLLLVCSSLAIVGVTQGAPGGSWGPLKSGPAGNWPTGLCAIHAIHIPFGKIVMWGFGTDNVGTQAYVYDARNDGFLLESTEGQFVIPGDDAFCSGHIQNSNGDAIVAGGGQHPVRQSAQPDWD